MKISSQITAAIMRFRPVEQVWAVAAGVEARDVRQEIAVAVLSGEDPARTVPRALQIRKVGGEWRSVDAVVYAARSDFLIDSIETSEEVELVYDVSGIAQALAGGTDLLAKRCGVGRRAAQMRVKAQEQRFELSGDLFAGGEAA